MKRLGRVLAVLLVAALTVSVLADGVLAEEPPPLPLHAIEGVGGVVITHSAYLVNQAKKDHVFGLPSVGAMFAYLGHGRHIEFVTITETLWDRVELGYAWNRFDLGDLPSDIKTALAISVRDVVNLHNFNLRVQLIKDGDFGLAWMPAVTAGVHYKYNQDIADIDSDLGGALKGLGIKDNDGVDFTLYASKLITALPRPVLVNAGMRYTEAAQIGLFGFTGDYDLVFEGSVVCLVTDRLGVGAEYRQKPDNYKKLPGLIKKEDDWWTLWAFYIVNDHLTVSGGYGHLGDVLNHAANATWGFNVKWEF